MARLQTAHFSDSTNEKQNISRTCNRDDWRLQFGVQSMVDGVHCALQGFNLQEFSLSIAFDFEKI